MRVHTFGLSDFSDIGIDVWKEVGVLQLQDLNIEDELQIAIRELPVRQDLADGDDRVFEVQIPQVLLTDEGPMYADAVEIVIGHDAELLEIGNSGI